MRVVMDRDPFLTSPPDDLDAQHQWHTGQWPAMWLSHPTCSHPPFVTAYRRVLVIEEAEIVRIHVTADERYALYLDGVRIGRGPERGDRHHWFFESYDLALAPGRHVLVAMVWALGDAAPLAQFTVRPGFILAAEDERWQAELNTGVAAWETLCIEGYTWFPDRIRFGAGANLDLAGDAFAWGFESGEGEGWVTPVVGPAGISAGGFDQHGTVGADHGLRPAPLPAMLERRWDRGRVRYVSDAALDDVLKPTAATDLVEEHKAWDELFREGVPLTVPAHTCRRVLLDLEDYVCAYTRLTTGGGAGATVRVTWAESLYEGELTEWFHVFHAPKGNRDAIFDKTFMGEGDIFRPDGGDGRVFENLWWNGGRYVEVAIRTADEPLRLEGLDFLETRYPMTPASQFASNDPRWASIWPIMVRALQMCSHETYMDCPYYEQLMYVGDTRLEVLVTYCLTRDDRLPRKAITMFNGSRLTNGLTQSRYPCRSTQVIPPFSLWWCGLVYDYALWRDDEAFVREMMLGVRGVLDAFWSYRNAQGLVEGPPGWNYTDWTGAPGWHTGTPPDGEEGVSGIINWQFALILTLVAELEAWLGEPENAAKWRRYAQAIADATTAAFWDEPRGLFADDLDHAHFSEHAQCLALLSGLVTDARRERVIEGLLSADDLTRTTIYFSHYLFETYRRIGRIDRLIERMDEWFELVDLGFKTTREAPEPSRSDCHAWGAHPIYHSFASLLGIRPAAFGFETVEIRPQLGSLTQARGVLVHPRGDIVADFTVKEGALTGEVILPEGVEGELVWHDQRVPLSSGPQYIEISDGAAAPAV